jgi:hypothetical protein
MRWVFLTEGQNKLFQTGQVHNQALEEREDRLSELFDSLVAN